MLRHPGRFLRCGQHDCSFKCRPALRSSPHPPYAIPRPPRLVSTHDLSRPLVPHTRPLESVILQHGLLPPLPRTRCLLLDQATRSTIPVRHVLRAPFDATGRGGDRKVQEFGGEGRARDGGARLDDGARGGAIRGGSSSRDRLRGTVGESIITRGTRCCSGGYGYVIVVIMVVHGVGQCGLGKTRDDERIIEPFIYLPMYAHR